MDEWLYDRVKQLKEIDDRLERIYKKAVKDSHLVTTAEAVAEQLNDLRFDLALMILKAEEEHAAF